MKTRLPVRVVEGAGLEPASREILTGRTVAPLVMQRSLRPAR